MLDDFQKIIDHVRVVREVLMDDNDLATFVLELIQYEDKAEMNLAMATMDEIQQSLGTDWCDAVQAAAEAYVRFGTALFRRIQALGTYENGYLHYQFKGWLQGGGDILLQRLEVPLLNQQKETNGAFQPIGLASVCF